MRKNIKSKYKTDDKNITNSNIKDLKKKSPGAISNIAKKFKSFYLTLKKENLPKLIFFALFVFLAGGILIVIIEVKTNKGMFDKLVDGLWWSVVTMTSVGYGDKYPITNLGRFFAIIIMIIGVVVTSILSGTIASIFVDRKIKEGRGLQDVNLRGHIVICGWNMNAEAILDGLAKLSLRKDLVIVLINEMDPEEFQTIATHHPDIEIKFVRGDFTNETILKKGSIKFAKSAIVVSDTSGLKTLDNADERTILSTLAIKSLNPDIRTSAELVNPDNEQHLKRANVDDILVNGEFNGFLFSMSTYNKGIPLLVKEMLSFNRRNTIKLISIPASFVGKTFYELLKHFKSIGKGIIIGLLSEEKKISFEDLISDDSSMIDAFIKRKFSEAEIDLTEEEGKEENIILNPEQDRIIKDTDSAFVICAVQGAQ